MIVMSDKSWTQLCINAPLHAPICARCRASWTHELQLIFVVIHAGFMADKLDPVLCISLTGCFQVVIARRRKEGENMFIFPTGVSLAGNSGEVGECYLVA